MANLQKIIKVTQEQYDILASGGTVGEYTGLDENYIYLVQDDSQPIINITNGITATHKQIVTENPETLIKYGDKIYNPYYADINGIPSYYSALSGDDYYVY